MKSLLVWCTGWLNDYLEDQPTILLVWWFRIRIIKFKVKIEPRLELFELDSILIPISCVSSIYNQVLVSLNYHKNWRLDGQAAGKVLSNNKKTCLHGPLKFPDLHLVCWIGTKNSKIYYRALVYKLPGVSVGWPAFAFLTLLRHIFGCLNINCFTVFIIMSLSIWCLAL